MITLHSVAEKIKKISKYVAIIFTALIFTIWIIPIVKQAKENLFPAPPMPPTVSFGKLPPIIFPKINEKKTYTYNIETLSGKLPQLPITTKVHTIINPMQSLLLLKKSIRDANSVNFTSSPIYISELEYKWDNKNNPKQSLFLNILYRNFTITNNNSDILDPLEKTKPSRDESIKAVQLLVNSLNHNSTDIDYTKTNYTYYKIENNIPMEIKNTANMQLIKINLFQNKINNLPIYYENPPYSTMNFLIDKNNEILSGEFFHYSPKEENATYPIKLAELAFEELKKGKAYIPYYGKVNKILIRNIFLAYYLGKENQQYIQPIIVFEGDDNFFAYVSAVSDEWVQNQ
ncbi:MAG: hypothetical protein EXS44_03275 [Candidatus Levybacteria bacterium]|nr:hypothetical protein [Candidatus Levybacteria bacterium]